MIKRFKKIIKSLPVIGPIVSWWINRKNKYKNATYWIEKYLSDGRSYIIQIGANDGVSGDPLFDMAQKHENWILLLVVPVLLLFDQLKNNYGNTVRVTYVNAAINEDGGSQSFYVIDQKAYQEIPNLSRDYEQIGSFDKQHLISLGGERLRKFIAPIEVQSYSLIQLLDLYEINHFDALLLDAEGYDWLILKQLDLEKHRPKIIFFEQTHLNSKDVQDFWNIFSEKYAIYRFTINFLCISKDVLLPGDLRKLSSKALRL